MISRSMLCLMTMMIAVHAATWAEAQTLDEVLPFIPRDVNVVSVLKVNALLDSPYGVEQNWAMKHTQAFLDGSITIPPWVQQFVRASHFTSGTRGEEWSVAFVPLDSKSRLEKIATLEGTEVQDLRGVPSVLSSRFGGYFVELHPSESASKAGLLGLIAPASRQEAANWIASADSGTKISKYLQQAIQDPKPQVILVMDMQDMLDPVQIRYRLDGAASVKDNKTAKVALTVDFQSLQGVRLSVTAGKTLTAEFRLDFKRSIGSESQYMKPLLLEFLNDAGAELDDFEAAEVSVVGNSVKLNAPLSDVSFRKILSLISTPHPSLGLEDMAKAPATSPPDESGSPYDLAASKRYFNAILKTLEDLEKTYQAKNGSYARSASWHLSYANRIDRMPTAGIPPELHEFAHSMSESLRVLADSLRGTQVDLKNLESKITYSKEYRYRPKTGYEWWWGPPRTAYGYVQTPANTDVIVHTNVDQIRQLEQKAAEEGATQRDQIWSNMAAQRDTVQKEMVNVFGRKFLAH